MLRTTEKRVLRAAEAGRRPRPVLSPGGRRRGVASARSTPASAAGHQVPGLRGRRTPVGRHGGGRGHGAVPVRGGLRTPGPRRPGAGGRGGGNACARPGRRPERGSAVDGGPSPPSGARATTTSCTSTSPTPPRWDKWWWLPCPALPGRASCTPSTACGTVRGFRNQRVAACLDDQRGTARGGVPGVLRRASGITAPPRHDRRARRRSVPV